MSPGIEVLFGVIERLVSAANAKTDDEREFHATQAKKAFDDLLDERVDPDGAPNALGP